MIVVNHHGGNETNFSKQYAMVPPKGCCFPNNLGINLPDNQSFPVNKFLPTFVLCFCLSGSQAQSYLPMPDSDAVWMIRRRLVQRVPRPSGGHLRHPAVVWYGHHDQRTNIPPPVRTNRMQLVEHLPVATASGNTFTTGIDYSLRIAVYVPPGRTGQKCTCTFPTNKKTRCCTTFRTLWWGNPTRPPS